MLIFILDFFADFFGEVDCTGL